MKLNSVDFRCLDGSPLNDAESIRKRYLAENGIIGARRKGLWGHGSADVNIINDDEGIQ